MSVNPFEPIELRLAILDSKIDRLLAAHTVKQELPDRINFDTFLELIGTKEHPASKAQGYHLTSKKLVPFKKLGSKLYFSRKEIIAWVETNTVAPFSPEDELKANLVKSAKKHLRNGK